MRGNDTLAGSLFSYVDLEKRVRPDHPLRVIRGLVNSALADLSAACDAFYSPFGRDTMNRLDTNFRKNFICCFADEGSALFGSCSRWLPDAVHFTCQPWSLSASMQISR